jgi:hypothetical protein
MAKDKGDKIERRGGARPNSGGARPGAGHPKGPIKYTPELNSKIVEAMEEYCQKTAIPILGEFAYNFGLSNIQCFYEIPELMDARERLIMKKAAQLEKGCLANQINATMAVFSLKQLGWSDKAEIKHTGVVQLVDDIK